MESTGDKWRAIAFSLALHAAVGLALFVQLLAPSAATQDAAGPAIEASLVSSPQQAANLAKEIRALEHRTAQDETPAPRRPRPQDSPQPQQLIPQQQLAKPDTIDQDEVRKLAEQAAAQKQLQEQEERRKQGQVDLDRKQDQQQEEIRKSELATVLKKRADTKRDIKLGEQALQQLRDQQTQLALNNPTARSVPSAPPHPPAGNNGKQQDLLAKYKQAIIDTANGNWTHADDVPQQVHCRIRFKQIPGGEVIDVKFLDCPFDAASRESVDRAMHKTPLPYAGFESVFPQLREGELDFCYPTEACTR
jgi:colicin import membrane protein